MIKEREEKRIITERDIRVFYAKIPEKQAENVLFSTLFCAEREEEIANTADCLLKEQKYYVWQLLLRVLHDNGANLTETVFFKTQQGKWRCPFCEFSLSHSGRMLAVALSPCGCPVGVDVEKIRFVHPKLAERLFDDDQKVKTLDLSATDGQKLLLTEWCKRESAYKAVGGKSVFDIKKIKYLQEEKILCCNDEQYIFSVAYLYDNNAPRRVFFVDYSDNFQKKY